MALMDRLIESRKRSIAKLDARVQELEVMLSRARPGAARVVLEGQVKLAVQRKQRLLDELAGLQEGAAQLQPSLPGDGMKKSR